MNETTTRVQFLHDASSTRVHSLVLRRKEVAGGLVLSLPPLVSADRDWSITRAIFFRQDAVFKEVRLCLRAIYTALLIASISDALFILQSDTFELAAAPATSRRRCSITFVFLSLRGFRRDETRPGQTRRVPSIPKQCRDGPRPIEF